MFALCAATAWWYFLLGGALQLYEHGVVLTVRKRNRSTTRTDPVGRGLWTAATAGAAFTAFGATATPHHQRQSKRRLRPPQSIAPRTIRRKSFQFGRIAGALVRILPHAFESGG